VSSTTSRAPSLTGWAMFAAIWLVIAGSFNLVEGITAIHKGNYVVNEFLFSNQDFWGWVLLIFGILQLVAGFMVFSGNPSGFMLGVSVATVAIFIWFFFLFAAPLGALIAVIVNGLVIYGLTVGSETT
jgi:uncharacterized membrane protein